MVGDVDRAWFESFEVYDKNTNELAFSIKDDGGLNEAVFKEKLEKKLGIKLQDNEDYVGDSVPEGVPNADSEFTSGYAYTIEKFGEDGFLTAVSLDDFEAKDEDYQLD